MARKLRATVHIPDADGTLRAYPAGTVPPDDVAARITNPDAWEEDLEEATKDELLEEAERRGVTVKRSAKKDEIVQALEESAGG